MTDTDYLRWKASFDLTMDQKEASFERAWLQLPHADLVRILAKLSSRISAGAGACRDGAEENGHLVQMAGVIDFLRQSGIHSDSDWMPIEARIPEQQALSTTLSKFRRDIADAATLHCKQNCQRIGVMSALKGAIDLSRMLDVPIEPLHHIFDELQDLEEGKKPGKLTTPDRTNENAEAGSAEWGLKASLWAVMEIRIRMGESVEIAASRVCRDCSLAVERLPGKRREKDRRLSTPRERLIGLRKTIGQDRYPRRGNARVVVSTVKEHLALALATGAPVDLKLSYEGMLKQVDRYLWRLL